MELGERYNNDRHQAGVVLRTSHAGAHAAARLYAGQGLLAGVRAREQQDEVDRARRRALKLRDLYAAELRDRGVSPTRAGAVCGAAAYALGMLTSLGGPQTVAATRLALERLMREQLQRHYEALQGRDHAAAALLGRVLAEQGGPHEAAAPRPGRWSRVIGPTLGAGARVLGWVGRRL